jgi:glycosyltransferase involved in cell wall biosynthesis
VAHVLRDDHAEHIGGDVAQARASVEALRMCGIDAFATTSAELTSSVDVVHLYNLQLPAQLLRSRRRAARVAPGAPIVLSPIYWPMDRAAVRSERGDSPRLRLLHAVGPRRRGEWLLNRGALARAAAVVPNSHIEAARISRYYRLPLDARWQVVPNGLWVDRWRVKREPPAGPAGSVEIACVARLEPQKNQRRLIAAVRALDQANLTLVGPAGDHRYADEVLAELVTLGSQGSWIPRLAQPELRDLLSRVHVHVLPSFRETPGLASMEAAMVGCGIVVTREGSAAEYFGELASYADPRSSEDIRAAIVRAAGRPEQPALAERMRRYDWSRVGEQLARLYQEVARSGQGVATG